MKLSARLFAISALLTPFFAIGAESPAPADAPATMNDAAAWLAAQQKEDGSFSNPQYPGLSGVAIMALSKADFPGKAEVLKKGYEFLVSQAQPRWRDLFR